LPRDTGIERGKGQIIAKLMNEGKTNAARLFTL
jgi:hypothetical protein